MKRVFHCVIAMLAMAGACSAFAQAKGTAGDAAGEKWVHDILALAKAAADDDDVVNFYGFFPGMSRHDAAALAAYYKLKDGEYSVEADGEKAVWKIRFSLKGVRRITKGGKTFDELAQTVSTLVGELKPKRDYLTHREWRECKTIDGILITMSDSVGLTIEHDSTMTKMPSETEAAKAERLKCEAAERQRFADAIPNMIKNMVPIPGKEYALGKYEVTQLEWEAVMGENPSSFKGHDLPVERVSWNDCQAFLEKLNAKPEVKKSGEPFRLPTEDEWEYACRAGATGEFCRLEDGAEISEKTLKGVAWFKENSNEKTHPVGQQKPNAYGLYDMHGNVWEWIDSAGAYRVIRGNCWSSGASSCTATYRRFYGPSHCYGSFGFRLARTLHK